MAMTERDALIVRNVLNGVEAEQLASTLGGSAEDVSATFAGIMRLVSEYVLVHCVAFFPCGSVPEARRNRSKVMYVLGCIQDWDDGEREVMVALFKGRDIAEYCLPREKVQEILARTLDAIPHYLPLAEGVEFWRDRKNFIANKRSIVIGAVERFVSFDNPLIYKNIENTRIDDGTVNAVAAVLPQQ
jgi:hypothetical protein